MSSFHTRAVLLCLSVFVLGSVSGAGLANTPLAGQQIVLAAVLAAASEEAIREEAINSGSVYSVADDNLTPLDESGRRLYIVRLTEPSLAAYRGGIAGLPATSPRVSGQRLDPQSPASQAYLAHLSNRQSEVHAAISGLLGRSVSQEFQYLNVLNAMALRLTPAEARRISSIPGLRSVMPDRIAELETDVGPTHIGAPSVWSGATSSGVATRGEGIIVGVLDTGINSQNPSFAATDVDGYTHTNPFGAGVYVGWCAANPGFCNDKLIGAWSFNPVGGSPEDDHNHGSHTASTAAGNKVIAEFDVGIDSFITEISGVAPRANVIAYKVCTPGCPQTASVAAINQAIDDGVDVLNYSISGTDNPWNDSVDLAFLDAFEAGIFVAASAGNSGPGASTVAKTGPWNASVGASTHNRVYANTVDATAPGPIPPDLEDLAAVPGGGPAIVADLEAEIVWAGDLGNTRGCTSGGGLPAGSMTGSIGLIQRGDCTFAEKVNNATAAGAVAVIVYNHVGGPPISMGGLEATSIPAVFIDNVDGDALAAFTSASSAPTARINASSALLFNDDWQDIMGGFSSRGPSQFEMLAPTIVAPGVNTLAAGQAIGGNPDQWVFSQGTSMSAPHIAGAGALMMALNPTWSPAEIRSALALSANPAVLLKEDGATAADPFDQGSGLADLDAAGRVGLVMDETAVNFEAANPDTGGNPQTLNLPAFVSYNCTEECVWTRTVTSVAPDPVTYTAQYDVPAGMSITVVPDTFAINPGATQELTITVDTNGMTIGEMAFADIRLVPQPGGALLGGPLLSESFSDPTFPPTGWSAHKLQGGGTQEWQRVTDQFNSSPASAHRRWSGSADGFQDDWLVTPPFSIALDGASLSFIDAGQWMQDYGYQGVWASTGSCDPADAAFVEVAEIDDTPGLAGTVTWRSGPVTLDLSAFSQETVCLAFRYSGTFAQSWWIDSIIVEEFEPVTVPTVHMPVAVIPALSVPVITVDPDLVTASQQPDETTVQTLTIGNDGGVDLDWEIEQAPVSVQLGLSTGGGNAPAGVASPFSLVLDGGVADTSIGVGGIQFLWLNRFTPKSYNFPITIDQVQVMFGSNVGPGGINVGELVDIYLYEDADGDPSNGATHRVSLNDQAVQAVNATTWSVYSLPAPVTFNGPGDIIIAVVNRTAGVTPNTFPASIDRLSGSHQRSWVGWGVVPSDPPDFTEFPSFNIIDNLNPSLAGNWLVRGFGTGVVPCDNPANVPWLDVDPAIGTTAPQGSSEVTLTLDSTGLASGTYEALLCISSNDPDNELVEVLVSLDVTEPPIISVDPLSISASQEAGSVTDHDLEISNLGPVDLVWNIEQSEVLAGSSSFLIHDQGPLITSTGDGPGGSDVSLLQNVSLGITTLGVAANLSGGGPHFRIADEFAVTGSIPWQVDQLRFFAYQTGSSTASSFTGVNYQIWDGPPDDPASTVVYGDTTTNRIVDTAWTNSYRYAETAIGNTQRPIMSIDAEGDFLLDPGTYWLDWQLAGSIASGPWQPPITIIGQTTTGSSKRLLSAGWEAFVDGGTGNPPQGVPFQLWGATGCDSYTTIPWLSVSPTSGTTPASSSDTVTVSLDSSGLAGGTYEATICIESNDLNNPVWAVPVTLEVIEVEAAVSFEDLVQTYTGDPLEVTVVTDPPGLAVEVTYSGSATPPTDTGSYAVEATVTEPGYFGSASDTFVIEPATASILFDDLQQFFTGSPLEPTITTDPAGLTINVTYDGSPTAPSAVGQYLVEVEIDEQNWAGSDSATFEILGPLGDEIFHDRFEE